MNDGRPRDSLVEFPTLSSPSLARGSYHEMMQRQLCYAVCYSYCADWLKIGCLFGALVAGLPQTLNAQTLNAQSAPSESNRRLVIVQRVNNASTTGSPTQVASTPGVTGGFGVPARPIVQAPVVLPSATPIVPAPVVVPNTQPMASPNYWARCLWTRNVWPSQ